MVEASIAICTRDAPGVCHLTQLCGPLRGRRVHCENSTTTLNRCLVEGNGSEDGGAGIVGVRRRAIDLQLDHTGQQAHPTGMPGRGRALHAGECQHDPAQLPDQRAQLTCSTTHWTRRSTSGVGRWCWRDVRSPTISWMEVRRSIAMPGPLSCATASSRRIRG